MCIFKAEWPENILPHISQVNVSFLYACDIFNLNNMKMLLHKLDKCRFNHQCIVAYNFSRWYSQQMLIHILLKSKLFLQGVFVSVLASVIFVKILSNIFCK